MLEKNEMIFGVRAVIEAIQAGKEIDKVLVKVSFKQANSSLDSSLCISFFTNTLSISFPACTRRY